MNFRLDLQKEASATIVTRDLLAGPVQAFAPNAQRTLDLLRRQLASKLRVREDSIFVVGSAKTGFSLAPDTFPKPFGPESDIDVVVIDQNRFDRLWLALIHVAYFERWARRISNVADQKRLVDLRENVALGHINPERCGFRDTVVLRSDTTLTNESNLWWDAFRGLGHLAEFARREVKGRLYRTRDHVIAYHAQGLDTLRSRLGAR